MSGEFAEEPAARCTVCARDVKASVACIDVDTGETLCPVHYRKRHFQKVFEHKKQEKWVASPSPSPRPLSSAISSSSAAALRTCLSTATAHMPVVPIQWDSPKPRNDWDHRWAQWLEDKDEERRLRARADEWRGPAELRRCFAGMRALFHVPSNQALRAHRHRLGRAFGGLLAATLSVALRRAEHRRKCHTMRRKRGFRALYICRIHAARTLAAHRRYATRACATALAVLRWNAVVQSSRSFVSNRHAASNRLEHWRQRAADRIRGRSDMCTAVLRHRWRAAGSSLQRWRSLTRLATVERLEEQIALKLHRRKGLLRAYRALAVEATECTRPSELSDLIEAEGQRAADAPTAGGRVVEEDVIAALAFERARADQLEQALLGVREELKQEREAAAAAQAAFRRERDALLNELGAANERLALQRQAHGTAMQHETDGVPSTPSPSTDGAQHACSTPWRDCGRAGAGVNSSKARRAFKVINPS